MIDEFQQQIIERQTGATLLLAGPGCGKTHILAQRIIYAHENTGVPYDSMLCLTFTNRAAREMVNRIEQTMGAKPQGLFVGNIHKFCLQFLFRNRLIASDTNIIDEEDRAEYLGTEFELTSKADVKDFCNLNTFLYQRDCGHPERLCRRLSWTPTEKQIENVRKYMRYKSDNHLLDFDDIILQAYTALLSPEARGYDMTGYRWVQVDEVQDVTPLQLAVVEMVTAQSLRTMLFLGDEQQAIFAFLGAGGAILSRLKRLCRDNIVHLQRNYRSADYLVDLTNRIAVEWLDAEPTLLPTATRRIKQSDSLVFYSAKDIVVLQMLAASAARHLLAENPKEDVAILTRTNDEAQKLSQLLQSHRLDHFLVSQRDAFNSPGFKTVWAHLAVIACPDNAYSWTRLLYQCKATRTLKSAREYARALSIAALRPHELFDYIEYGRPTSLQRLLNAMDDENATVVVMDTETTGLDIFRNDVVQFAAVKMRAGKVVEGSPINFFIEGGQELPRTLGSGVRNPLCSVYETANKLSPEVAFRLISEYLDGADVVAGHNVAFDVAILRENFRRCCDEGYPAVLHPDRPVIDTLSLARLLYPKLRHFSLGALLERLNLAGNNCHNAADDVEATVALLTHLTSAARSKIDVQYQFLAGKNYMAVARKLFQAYGQFYKRGRALLLADSDSGDALLKEIKLAHSYFVAGGYIRAVDKFHYILELIRTVVTNGSLARNFREQIFDYLAELRTFSESDLFANHIVRERLSVMTVHKAKGLEMDNVIIYDAATDFGTVEERARVLYVACSRPKRRLYVGCQGKPSEILAGVLPHFREISAAEQQALLMKEYRNRHT